MTLSLPLGTPSVSLFFFLLDRRQPTSTRTDTLLPSTTLFRSVPHPRRRHAALVRQRRPPPGRIRHDRQRPRATAGTARRADRLLLRLLVALWLSRRAQDRRGGPAVRPGAELAAGAARGDLQDDRRAAAARHPDQGSLHPPRHGAHGPLPGLRAEEHT